MLSWTTIFRHRERASLIEVGASTCLPNTYNILGNWSTPSLKDLFVVLSGSYFSSALMAQLMAMGHPIPVICNKMQMIPEIGRPMVKNISQGRQTDKWIASVFPVV